MCLAVAEVQNQFSADNDKKKPTIPMTLFPKNRKIHENSQGVCLCTYVCNEYRVHIALREREREREPKEGRKANDNQVCFT